MKLPKLPKLPSIKSLHLPSRITMERLLIVSAAALVVVLAVRGGQQTKTAMQQTDFTPDVSTQTIADASPDVEIPLPSAGMRTARGISCRSRARFRCRTAWRRRR